MVHAQTNISIVRQNCKLSCNWQNFVWTFITNAFFLEKLMVTCFAIFMEIQFLSIVTKTIMPAVKYLLSFSLKQSLFWYLNQ